ncbi:MAG: T9SS C-terminal target domain-containing protein [Flavobacteriales bacterium]|nr:T9SS C-terminal target domain-containing protein [Flavobacteriales bacterium]NDA97592.1 T9SS C-terminal target domain-containing protein [Flavobacteriia bacterium]NDC27715.1 T9SS C-terminal target domain-containing protein [Crocinitomicaceae bacterium]
MKKNNAFTLLLVLLSFMGNTQAVLPTSWSFTTANLPTGWSESGTMFYAASGNTPPAMKFDNTGDYLLINFNSNAGNLTYYLTGNSFAGGTFTVEESNLGSVWTTLHSHTSPPSATYTMFTDVPLATTRFIRFIYTNKVTGNIGLDDVNITVGAATPAQEINVKQGATTIVSGGSYFASSSVASMTPSTFTIENLGTLNTLNIASATISGTNAADFSVASFPSSVLATSTGNLVLNFTPAASGTRIAVLTIASNDADEASYIVNLYGVGGTLATEPSSQASNLVFSNVKTYRINASFTGTAAVDGYLVLRKKGSPITGVPVDGTVYQRGDIVGDAQVVFSRNATSFSPNNIIAGTTYYFAIYTYNGPNNFRNYNTTAPLLGNSTTPATMLPASYYSTLNTGNSSFEMNLHALVNPHQMQFYSNYANFMVYLFEARDTTLDRRVVTCVYSGENKIYTEPFDWSSNGYSREHTYCHSWMPTNPAQALPEYNDYHHLFPTNLNDVNIVRSNNALGVVVNVTSTYLGSKFGTDANGQTVFEPRDEHKGDAARALMYEAICYTTISGNSWALPNYQNQYLLKQWHFQDPPDNWEIARNDFIDSLQNNRNPFVDSIDYACFVNFSNMTYEPLACEASINELLNNGFITYPNPSKDEINLHVDATTISSYQIIDFQGRVVLSSDVNNLALVKANISKLNAGTYLVKVETPFGTAQRSIVVE